MSGGKPTVPKWWSDQRRSAAHERLLGSIQFYRSKWEGGAHWESSEDQPRPGFDQSLQATAPNSGQPPEWPGYDQTAALSGYQSRYNKCKENRAAFERPKVGAATSLNMRSSDAAKQHVNDEEAVKRKMVAERKVIETRQNLNERAIQRNANKKMAVEASTKLVRPRPGYVLKSAPRLTVKKGKDDWYGRKNTCPW
jgi:hypothetical protein